MLNRSDFNYTYDVNDYMIQYKGKNIGGAGIMGTYKGRGKQVLQQLNDYKKQAERTIDALINKRGYKYMLENIEKINTKQ